MRERFVELTTGTARLVIDAPAAGARAARGMLLLGHGAGGRGSGRDAATARAGADSTDLVWLAGTMPHAGWLVLRIEQPWLVAGRQVSAPPPTLDRGWLEVVDWLGRPAAGVLRRRMDQPFVVGGRSAGARVACRTATQTGADAVVALAFPLHPPGRPERSRAAELLGPPRSGVPTLVVQGTRDAFGGPDELPALTDCGLTDPALTVCAIDGADHTLRVGRPATPGPRQLAAQKSVVAAVTQFLAQVRDSPKRSPAGNRDAGASVTSATRRRRRRDAEQMQG